MLGGLTLSTAGCPSQPVMELYSARVAFATPQGIGLNLTMSVRNENAFDVQVRNVRGQITIEERYALPPIQVDPNKWLGANSTTLVQVPVVIPWNMIQPLLAKSVGANVVAYRFRGAADVTVTRAFGISVKSYGVDDEGEFSRGQLMIAAGRGVFGN